MALTAAQIALSAACRGAQRRHQRVRVNLQGRYMLADRSEFPCRSSIYRPAALPDRAGLRHYRRPRHRLCGPSRPPGGQDRPPVAERLCHDDHGISRKARHARRAAHLACQSAASSTCRRTAADGRFVPKITSARLIMPNGTNIGVRLIGHLAVRAPASAPRNGPESAAHVRRARSRAGWSAIWNRASRSEFTRGCAATRTGRTESPRRDTVKRRVSVLLRRPPDSGRTAS